ncbi:MAG: DUF3795 domain-containing protein [Chloroflexota bacterium]
MTIEVRLIAPCGMNCGICLAYLRTKNRCDGCRGGGSSKPPYCTRCIVVNCEYIRTGESGFCYDCPKLPCRRIRDLDKRYRTRYGMSMLENLADIRDYGLEAFLEKETERWRCPECNAPLCVHRPACLQCGAPRTGEVAWPTARDSS